jgi:hypothetical protein
MPNGLGPSGRPVRPAKAKGPGALGFPLGAGGGQVGRWSPRVSLGRWPPTPLRIYKPPYPLAHSSHLFPSSLWHSSHVWNRASELEETPCDGRCRVARFPVQILLVLLLCWTGARTTSIHHMCVIPRRPCSGGAGLLRLVQLHDLQVGFGCLP